MAEQPAEGPQYVTKHTAFVYDRGGDVRLFELHNITQVVWGRIRDDISEAAITISATPDSAWASDLANVEPGRHELVIFRGDNHRPWEGPITLLEDVPGKFVVHARDVMHYATRLAMANGYDNSYPNVDYAINRAKTIMVTEFARKDAAEAALGLPSVNVIPFITDHQTPTDAKTSRKTLPYEQTVWEQVDDLAAKGGIDYCVLGRAVHLWDTSKALGQTPTATEADFLGDLNITVYGMELGTRAIVTDGQGNYGDSGGVDPYYGLVERLDTAYDETDDGPAPTSAEMASQAQRNNAGRNPTPLQVRVPDNSTVNPKGVLTLDLLVPGVHIPLLSTTRIRTVNQMQKLSSMKVTETAAGESVTVTMYPAASPDDVEGA